MFTRKVSSYCYLPLRRERVVSWSRRIRGHGPNSPTQQAHVLNAALMVVNNNTPPQSIQFRKMLFGFHEDAEFCHWLADPNCVSAGQRFELKILPVLSLSQQTRHIDPTLGQCWPDVFDVGPALTQRWVNVSCFLGWCRFAPRVVPAVANAALGSHRVSDSHGLWPVICFWAGPWPRPWLLARLPAVTIMRLLAGSDSRTGPALADAVYAEMLSSYYFSWIGCSQKKSPANSK